MAKSKARSRSRPAEQPKSSTANGVQAAPTNGTTSARPVTPGKTSPRRSRAYSRRSRSWLDWRWLAVGVVALALLTLIVVNTNPFGIFGGQGATGSSSVGEITGPSINQQQRAAATLPVGTPAPNLTWTVGGEGGSIESLKGQPVLVEFFASWCPHCQKETAVIRQIQNKYGDRIKIVAVSASPYGMDQRSPSSPADIERFQRTHNAPYQHFYDKDLVGGRLYGVNSFPTMYLLDKNGVIQYAAEGEVTEPVLAGQIDKLLAS